MYSLTPDEYDALLLKIKQAEDRADHHSKKRNIMASCVALLIAKAIYAKGLKLSDNKAMCGTARASLLSWWRMAYGDTRPEGIFTDNAGDILRAIGYLEDGEAQGLQVCDIKIDTESS